MLTKISKRQILSINQGFIPGNHVQIASGEMKRIENYMHPDGMLDLEGDICLHITEVRFVQTEICRCHHDWKFFVGKILAFPSMEKQTSTYCKDGDFYIDCPHCQRRYFLNDEGEYYADRNLEVLDS